MKEQTEKAPSNAAECGSRSTVGLGKQLTRDDILKIAEQLDGTCGSLDDALGEYGLELHEVPVDLLTLLDDHVMQCVTCGWWSDSSGIDDDQVCEECNET